MERNGKPTGNDAWSASFLALIAVTGWVAFGLLASHLLRLV